MNRLSIILAVFTVLFILTAPIKPAYAACCPPVTKCTQCPGCPAHVGTCYKFCKCVSDAETGKPSDPLTTMGHITDEFNKQRKWIVEKFFKDDKEKDHVGLLGAMQLMTSQLVTIGMWQVNVIGTFFDAKHQLETQQIFQHMTAMAHKDYHPSEELCNVGSSSKSLYASSRNTDLTAAAISKRSVDRQLMGKGTLGVTGGDSDKASRLMQFKTKYCNKKDNSGELDLLCKNAGNDPKLFNRDVSYTSTIDSPLTLKLDFSDKDTENSEDEQAFFAMTANLFAHDLFPPISANALEDDKGETKFEAAKDYMDARALIAKRSVASNSIAAIAALKSAGEKEVKPFIYALMKELSGDKMSDTDIKEYLGENPSYYAQMEVLAKKLYQTPNFYSGLYDKPANVMRQDVALQAATLMQKRDLYRSYLRSEMILAVMLDVALDEEMKLKENEADKSRQEGKAQAPGG